MLRIRLSMGGVRKRPIYKIVVADGRYPRDGKFIEKLGSYNPLLPKDKKERIKVEFERVKYCIIRMSIKPEQVANADRNIFFKLLLFSNRIAELTRIELDKKKIACSNLKKAVSIGTDDLGGEEGSFDYLKQNTKDYLASEEGAWCRNMPD